MQWSPDGSLLAFSMGSPENNSYDIFVVAPDGSGLHNVTRSPDVEVNPTWSPDGKMLAVEVLTAANVSIEVMNADGSGRHTVVPRGMNPRWSPAGSRIAYVGDNPETESFDVFSVGVDGSDERTLTRTEDAEGALTWSPDSRQIAYEVGRGDSGDLWLMDADGSNQHRVIGPLAGNGIHNPDWSPDGRQIVYSSATEETESFDIYVSDIDGGNQRRLTTGPDAEQSPAWQPVTGATPPSTGDGGLLAGRDEGARSALAPIAAAILIVCLVAWRRSMRDARR
jgi:Tol biopolymer transport system component